MVKSACIALIVIGIVHLFVLGVDLPVEVGNWSRLNLWTFEHWHSVHDQPVDLALSGGVFWATVASFAMPLITLAWLLLWLEKRGVSAPPFVGWALFAWSILCTALMPPSGFPVLAVIVLVLALGLQRGTRGNRSRSHTRNP